AAAARPAPRRRARARAAPRRARDVSAEARDPGAAGCTASPGRCGRPEAARDRDARPPRDPLRLRYDVLLSLRSVTAYELQPLLRQGSRQFRQPDGHIGVSGTRLTYYHH